MTQIVDKKLKNMCNHCQSLLNKPCAWLSLGNEYCDEIMEIQKELEYQKEMEEEYNEKHTKLMQKYSKQKEVLDKIKEYIKQELSQGGPSELKDLVNGEYILELLEEIK